MKKKSHDVTTPIGLNSLHNHEPVRYEMPTKEEIDSIPADKAGISSLEDNIRVHKPTAISQLQKILNAFPWDAFEQPKPNLKITGEFDSKTQLVIQTLTEISKELMEPNLIKMLNYIKQGDFFNAQSVGYIAKTMLSKKLHQFKKYPEMSPEMKQKYPGIRKWTRAEVFAYLKTSPYAQAGYFPAPWDLSRLGRRGYDGSFGCDPNKRKCDISYYENFMKWGPPSGTMGSGLAQDPRLISNMDNYPNIWSNRAIRYRMLKHIPSPHIPSPGTGAWMDVNNLPKGKYFLDEQDKKWYFQLLALYNQFKQDEKERGTSYIAPPSSDVILTAKLLANKYYIK